MKSSWRRARRQVEGLLLADTDPGDESEFDLVYLEVDLDRMRGAALARLNSAMLREFGPTLLWEAVR